MKSIKDILEAAKMKGKDPCWKDYQMVGMKDKGGKKVPNCVPEEVQQEGAIPAHEKVITVKHKSSGKTLRISANAAAKYRTMGYHFHPTNEEVELDEDLSKMPTDKLQKHWDSHKDEQRPSPAFASKLKLVAKELAKRKSVKEETELNEDDNLSAIAKKHGMNFHRGTYGANMTHPTKGYVNVNRYGEWSHHPVGKGTTGHGPAKAHGDSSHNFSGLDKHLSSIKESVEQIDEISDTAAANYVRGRSLGYAKKMAPDSNGNVQPADVLNKMSDKHKAGISRAMDRLVKPVKEDNKPEQDTPAKASLMKRAEKPTAYVHEGAMKDIDTNKQEDERLAKRKSWSVEGKWKKVKSVVTDKSGAKHGAMSRARDVAAKAAQKTAAMAEQSNVKPNPFTVPSINPGKSEKPESEYVKARNAGSSTKNARARAAGAANPHMFESRQADIIREAMKAGKEKKKQKEQSTGTADKFIDEPELSSKITKS